jgi:hypothetical protein
MQKSRPVRQKQPAELYREAQDAKPERQELENYTDNGNPALRENLVKASFCGDFEIL